jgi:protein phosphatase PTC2/3
LALSRAIGDFDFKKSKELDPKEQIVTGTIYSTVTDIAFPDVKENKLDDWDEFVVLACDGIWDCLTNAQVIEFVRRGIVERQELHKIAENLMDNCLAPSSDGGGYGCDNMTVIIVALLNGQTKEQWYDMIIERVKNKDGPVAPKKFGILFSGMSDFIARFLGPGFNQFQNYNNENEEDSNTSDEGDSDEHPIRPKKSEADDEDWGTWKNGEEFRHRFIRTQRPGRIIHLGDGSELLTDKNNEDHDVHMSDSSEEDSDDEEPKKMQFDEASERPSEPPSHPQGEVRYQSPSPTSESTAPQPASEK